MTITLPAQSEVVHRARGFFNAEEVAPCVLDMLWVREVASVKINPHGRPKEDVMHHTLKAQWNKNGIQ